MLPVPALPQASCELASFQTITVPKAKEHFLLTPKQDCERVWSRQSMQEASMQLSVPVTSVQSIIKKRKEQAAVTTIPRMGVPKKTTPRWSLIWREVWKISRNISKRVGWRNGVHISQRHTADGNQYTTKGRTPQRRAKKTPLPQMKHICDSKQFDTEMLSNEAKCFDKILRLDVTKLELHTVTII